MATLDVIQVETTLTPGATKSTPGPPEDIGQKWYFWSIAPTVRTGPTRPGLYADAESPELPAAAVTGMSALSALRTILSKPGFGGPDIERLMTALRPDFLRFAFASCIAQ